MIEIRHLHMAHAIADPGPIHDPDGMLAQLQACQAIVTCDQLKERQDAAIEARFRQRLAEDASNPDSFLPPFADVE